MTYINQDGVERISTLFDMFAGSASLNRFTPIPLAQGDTGVRKVLDITILFGGGAAGNYGIVLYKPLAMYSLDQARGTHVMDAVSSGGMIGGFSAIHSDAYLSFLSASSSGSIPFNGTLISTED